MRTELRTTRATTLVVVLRIALAALAAGAVVAAIVVGHGGMRHGPGGDRRGRRRPPRRDARGSGGDRRPGHCADRAARLGGGQAPAPVQRCPGAPQRAARRGVRTRDRRGRRHDHRDRASCAGPSGSACRSRPWSARRRAGPATDRQHTSPEYTHRQRRRQCDPCHHPRPRVLRTLHHDPPSEMPRRRCKDRSCSVRPATPWILGGFRSAPARRGTAAHGARRAARCPARWQVAARRE
jgi:hypothetical protein